MYNVRIGKVSDIPDLLAIAPDFVVHYKHIEYNEECVSARLHSIINDGVSYIAEYNGVMIGFMLGIYTTNIWSGEPLLQEVAWWVEEEYRSTGVGIDLLKAFESSTTSKVALSILPHTEVSELFLTKMGYTLVESAYIKE